MNNSPLGPVGILAAAFMVEFRVSPCLASAGFMIDAILAAGFTFAVMTEAPDVVAACCPPPELNWATGTTKQQ